MSLKLGFYIGKPNFMLDEFKSAMEPVNLHLDVSEEFKIKIYSRKSLRLYNN